MRLAKISRTLLMTALPAVLATCCFAQEHPNVSPNAVRDQLMKSSSGATPQAAPAAKLPPPTKTPAPAKTPDASKASAMPAPKAATVVAKPGTAKPSTKAPTGPVASKGTAVRKPVEKPAEEKVSVARRDPFDTLLNKAKAGNGTPENLPPGKAGLVVATLKIDGIVRNTGGMIAIVSNPQQRVYFLREGDKLYDGSVDKISLDAVSFHELGKDAFGKPLERQVTKRLYPSPGEAQ